MSRHHCLQLCGRSFFPGLLFLPWGGGGPYLYCLPIGLGKPVGMKLRQHVRSSRSIRGRLIARALAPFQNLCKFPDYCSSDFGQGPCRGFPLFCANFSCIRCQFPLSCSAVLLEILLSPPGFCEGGCGAFQGGDSLRSLGLVGRVLRRSQKSCKGGCSGILSRFGKFYGGACKRLQSAWEVHCKPVVSTPTQCSAGVANFCATTSTPGKLGCGQRLTRRLQGDPLYSTICRSRRL